MGKVDEANRIINLVRDQTDEVILFCSLGKDSLVLLDLLYPKFRRIVCVFMYFVKGLEHVERYIHWAQARYPSIEFVQIPHWNLTHILRNGMCCVPNPKVKLLKLSNVEESMRLKYGIDYVFYGMKKADSMNRRLMLNTYENYTHAGKVYPLADWKQKDILAYMRQHKLPEPVRYSKKASGGVGLNLDCLLWLRKHSPGDLQKILSTFPLAEKILFDYDHANRTK